MTWSKATASRVVTPDQTLRIRPQPSTDLECTQI